MVSVETLSRHPSRTRFLNNPVLQHLEKFWAEPQPYTPAQGHSERPPGAEDAASLDDALRRSLRLVMCSNPEAEVTLAAHEILRHVRAGGRYREVTVLSGNWKAITSLSNASSRATTSRSFSTGASRCRITRWRS